MNPHDPSEQKLDQLFAAARARRADTSAAEYGFETRLLARLRAEREATSPWAVVSWRLLPFFAACVVILAVWQYQIVAETQDTAQVAFIEGNAPAGVELLD